MHSVLGAVALLSVTSTVAAQAGAWAQCGGKGFSGATSCVSGYSCKASNDWYSQCVPGSAGGADGGADGGANGGDAPPPPTTTTTTTPAPVKAVSTTTSSDPAPPAASNGTGSKGTGPSSGGSGAWEVPYQKAKAALAKLTNSEKVDIVTGVGWQNGPCVGNTGAVSKIGFPALCLQDGPLGIRYVQNTTAFPPGVQAAATWDLSLIRARGAALGAESKGVGIHVQLAPVAGPLGKVAPSGRTWEGFATDPYFTGLAMSETIKGLQGAGVQACAKHYLGNEQEKNRETMSSNIPDRALHELYLWPFADAINANVASVMCSYNKLNSTWACENDQALNKILKGELNFQGYVVSDWNAQHSTNEAAINGLDMTMPGTDFNKGGIYWGKKLLDAVTSGAVPQSRLDDMVTRILAAWYLLGQDGDYPTVGWSSWNGGKGAPNVMGTHSSIVRAVARDGIVLLKNSDKALPLNKPASLALVGSAAVVNPDGMNACEDKACNNGTLGMGWGSGTVDYPYFVDPATAIKAQAAKDGTKVTLAATDVASTAASAASSADTAIVFITADGGEGYLTVEGNVGDRNNLDPWHDGNKLVQAVAAVNKNVIVVVQTVGPIILETILAEPNVKAIVWAGLGSQESGNALVDIIYGSTTPSGKLPYTIAVKPTDYSCQVVSGDDDFKEDLYIDYRHFDKANIAPRYEFGFGLSYTTFDYSGLKVSSISTAGGLYDTVATVTATIANNGTVAGAEAAQLYIGLPPSAPPSPPKQLRGFQKLSLAAGASGTATFSLRKKDLSYWDVASQSWKLPTGAFKVSVGASSRDIRLTGTLQ